MRLRPFYSVVVAHCLGSYAMLITNALADANARRWLAKADGGDILVLTLFPLLSWYNLIESLQRGALHPADAARTWFSYVFAAVAGFLLARQPWRSPEGLRPPQ
jgi:hypothetical protein